MTPRTSAQGKSTATRTATTSVEDYAKTIYGLAEWDDAKVTASAIAKALGVSNPSVTLMIRKMAELGLVDHKPYSPVLLTPAGEDLALSMVRRHRLIETWLVTDLSYGWDEVHDEAERLEHSVSEKFVDRLDERLGYPRVDPHGDPIPDMDLNIHYPNTELLCRVSEASHVTLEQVDDAVPDALRLLKDQMLEIGAHLTILSSTQDKVVIESIPPKTRTESSALRPVQVPLDHSIAHAMRVSFN